MDGERPWGHRRGKRHPKEVREAVEEVIRLSSSMPIKQKTIAKELTVSESYVSKVKRKMMEGPNGSKRESRRVKFTQEIKDYIVMLARENNHLNRVQLCALLNQKYMISVSPPSLSRILIEAGFRQRYRKKGCASSSSLMGLLDTHSPPHDHSINLP